jgi:hypothetical protein
VAFFLNKFKETMPISWSELILLNVEWWPFLLSGGLGLTSVERQQQNSA